MSNVNDVKATILVITGDFKAKLSELWSVDKDNAEGQEINSSTSALEYSQLIRKPTHVTKESFTYIDLIFETSANLIWKTVVELLIFEKCHHSLIYVITDFKTLLLPPYLREGWGYKNANVNHIQSAVSSIDCDFLFGGTNVTKVDILNDCLKNVFENFNPNRLIICIYRDSPWMTDVTKSKLK